jgi:hypothetical protein
VAWVELRMGAPFIGVLGGQQGEAATPVLMAAIEGVSYKRQENQKGETVG